MKGIFIGIHAGKQPTGTPLQQSDLPAQGTNFQALPEGNFPTFPQERIMQAKDREIKSRKCDSNENSPTNKITECPRSEPFAWSFHTAPPGEVPPAGYGLVLLVLGRPPWVVFALWTTCSLGRERLGSGKKSSQTALDNAESGQVSSSVVSIASRMAVYLAD
jgi:hypothetical protein